MSPENVRLAAQKLSELETADRGIRDLISATRLQVCTTTSSQAGIIRLQRTRRTPSEAWSDGDAEALHQLLIRMAKARRDCIARELRQLDVSIPEQSP